MPDPKPPSQEDLAKQEAELRHRSAIVKSSTALMPYGTPEELAEMMRRVRFMVPGGDNMTDREVAALSQAAFTVGLNPIVQECTWINGFVVCIRGLRRLGHEQLERRFGYHGYSEFDYRAITDLARRDELKIPDGALAFEAILVVRAKKMAWSNTLTEIREALGKDAPWQQVLDLAGPPPEARGYGYITKEQMAELDSPLWYHKCAAKANNVVARRASGGGTWFACALKGPAPCPSCNEASRARENSMPHIQRAMKRAEAHAWKQECDLPFAFGHGGEGMIEDEDAPELAQVIDGKVIDLDAKAVELAKQTHMTGEQFEQYRELVSEEQQHQAERASMPAEERKATARADEEALFPDVGKTPPAAPPTIPAPDPKGKRSGRKWPSVYTEMALREGFAQNGPNAVGAMNLSPWADPETKICTVDDMKVWLQYYRGQRNRQLKADPRAAASEATEMYYDSQGKIGLIG